MRRGLRAGALLAALYAAVVLGTAVTTDRPVRPLLDAAGGALPYKWVKPPWYVGSTNVKPRPSHTDIDFENGTSPLIGVTSEDAQVILNLPQAALPPREGDTAVRAAFTPLDPGKLADLPGGMRPDGNAYRVEMTYQPSGEPLRETTAPGNVVMVVPDEAEKMVFSADGKGWEELPSHMLGDPNTVGSPFTRPGYYLVGTTLPEFANPNKGKGTRKTLGIVLIVAALALLLGYVFPTILRRSRAAQAAGPRGGAARTRPVKRRKR